MKKIPQPLYYLAAALALGGYIFFFERGPVKTDKDADKDKKTKIFANYVADDIQQIKLENLSTTINASKAPIVLTKDKSDTWQILEPKAFKADESTVRNMLSTAADFNPESTIENAANLADFGLNSPSARCSFISKSGTPFVVLVGDKNVTGASVYIKTTLKNDVYMVPSYSVDGLRKSVNDYRDKTFFKTDGVLAQKIQVVHGGKKFVFAKDKDNVWNIIEPIKAKADEQRVKDLLNAVTNLRIVEFENDHPSNLAVYGLSKPSASIEVWSSDGKEDHLIELGRKKLKANQYFAKSGDLPYVYVINDYFDKTLDIDPTNYRQKDMMKFDASQAKSLTVKHDGKVYVYQKDDKGQWTAEGRAKANDEGTYIANTLANTVITGFGSKKDATGLKTPNYSIEVSMASSSKRYYHFGNTQKGSVFLASDLNNDVYLVPSNILSQLDVYYTQMLTPVAVASPAAK
ncbi:MAG TPA: DUF4340 domain-containing protein [bacterium]|jgi:hypothetical protein|nr:DUF4340 domain-containing protein [bacterium]